MKNECAVVRDVLPLYLENMVSEDTAAFVREHLASCPECAAELAAISAGAKTEKAGGRTQNDLEEADVKAIKALGKKIRRKIYRTAAALAAVALVLCTALHFFPVYRITEIGSMAMGGYYAKEEIGKALCIGSASDRREAQSVLRLADQAFNDTRHTRAENEEEYGLLARYATATDVYGDVSFNEHSLELWSAHLDENEGWIWVFYSSETFNHDGSTACGSWRIPSLWKVERNESGAWVVVQIREHP